MSWTPFAVADGSISGWQRGRGEGLVLVLHGGPGLTDYTQDLADEVAEAVGA